MAAIAPGRSGCGGAEASSTLYTEDWKICSAACRQQTELSDGIQTTASGRQSTPSTGSVDGHNSHRSRPRWFVKAYRSRLGAEVAAPSVRHARLGRGWLLAAGASFEELVQAVGAASDGAVLVSRGREQRGRRGLAHQQQIDEKRLDSRAPTALVYSTR